MVRLGRTLLVKVPMKSISSEYLGCGFCMGEHAVKDVLDVAKQSWPEKKWIRFECLTCGQSNHLLILTNQIIEGYLSGFPAPEFVNKRPVYLDDLRVKYKKNTIEISSLNLRWSIPR